MNTYLHRHSPRANAFTLMEVLAALTIFALGAVSVLAMFPVAARIQSETMHDVISQTTLRNAEAYLKSRKLNLDYLNSAEDVLVDMDNDTATAAVRFASFRKLDIAGTDTPLTDLDDAGNVMPLPKSYTDTAAAGYYKGWLEADRGLIGFRDRCFPSIDAIGDNSFTWVPLVRRINTPVPFPDPTTPTSYVLTSSEWEVFIFVVRNHPVARVSMTTGGYAATVNQSLSALTADDIGAEAAVMGAGGEGKNLVATITSLTPSLNAPCLKTIGNTNFYIPGRVLSAAVKIGSDNSTLEFTDTYINNTNRPDISGGQKILTSNGIIYNVTNATTKTVTVSALILPDSNGKLPTRIWFGSRGTAQIIRLDGPTVIKDYTP